MNRRRRDPDDPDRIHREMLEHLEEHPPPKADPKPARPPTDSSSTPKAASKATPSPRAPRPELMLRRLRYEEAMLRLARFLEFHASRGTPDVRVIHGKGLHSGEAGPVLRDAVVNYCDDHPQWVRSHHPAPRAEGGDGALIVVLNSRDTTQ